MRHAVALALMVAPVACGGIIVTVGAGRLPEIDVDRSYVLGEVDLSACPAGRYEVRDASTGGTQDVTVERGGDGSCALTFAEPGVLLFDDAQARRANDALQGRDVQVRSGVLIVKAFSVSDQNDASIDLGDRITSTTVLVDGVPLIYDSDLTRLASGDVVVELPDPLLQKVAQAVKAGSATRVDVAARLVFPESELSDLPSLLHLRMRLQPEVELGVPIF